MLDMQIKKHLKKKIIAWEKIYEEKLHKENDILFL